MTEERYTRRLDEALAFVADAFRGRSRKGSGVPYLAHLLQVMVTVAEHGGDEDLMIAALLHDYLEDIEGSDIGELRRRFGDRVARIVEALSDSTTHPKPPWQDRKTLFIASIAQEPAEVRLVCAADKLHNARSTCRDLLAQGEATWSRFRATRDQSLWYYREVTLALGQGWSHPLLTELESQVAVLHEAAGSPSAPDDPTHG